MSDEDDPFSDRETVQMSISLPVEFVERLEAEYPAASSAQRALRIAASEGLRQRED